jgi:putative ABC transport system permease protein
VLGTAALAAIGTLTGAIERELTSRGRMPAGRRPAIHAGAARSLGRRDGGDARSRHGFGRHAAAGDGARGRRRGGSGELKAVDARWPLYGALTLEGGRSRAGAAAHRHDRVDRPGVADRLDVTTGGKLRIGDALLTIGGVIADEPDRLSEGFSLGPTVIVSPEALAASGLVSPDR